MKPTNDDNECMFVDKTDKAEYIRAEDHKIVLDKLKKFEQSNNDMKNDLTDMMKYISQLEKYVYKMESNDDEQSNEEDVDVDVDEDTDEIDVDVDEPSNETDDVETKFGMKFNFELKKDEKSTNYITQKLLDKVIKYSLSLLETNEYVNKINSIPKVIKKHNNFILVWDGEFKQIEDIFMHIARQMEINDIFQNIPFIYTYKEIIILYKENESNETDVDDGNMVTEDEIRFVKWFDNNKDYSRNWEKKLKIVNDIKSRLFKQ